MGTGITYLFINGKNEHDAKKIMRTISVHEVNISPVVYLTKLGTLYNIYYIISVWQAGCGHKCRTGGGTSTQKAALMLNSSITEQEQRIKK